MTRADWVIVAIVFVVVSFEALVALAFLPAQLLPDTLFDYLRGGEVILVALAALCGWYVAKRAVRERRRAREIAALPTQLERLSVEPEEAHISVLDYCLLLPIFLIAHGVAQVLVFIMVLDLLVGVPLDSIPYRAQFATCAFLAGALTFSDTRARIRRRRRRALDRRARQLAKRAAALRSNRCPSCDYIISGLPERRCPECGEPWSEEEEAGTNERRAIGIPSPGSDRGHLEGRSHPGSGMSALVSLCVLALVQIANAQCEPPVPDFEDAIDYQAWYESCVRGPYNEKQNAAPIYLMALGASDGKALVSTDALGFAGPLNSDSNLQPRPWDPQKNTEWEESYERSRKTLAQFAAAAERPYALFPPVHMEGRPRLLCYLSPLHHGGLNICVKASIDNAWRAPRNEVDGDAIVAATRTTLLVARQAEREPFLLPYMASAKWRALCYDNLRYALHYSVLSREQRAAALKVLRDVDAPMPGFWTALYGNEAAAYDFYQALLAGRVGEDDLERLGGPEKLPDRESVKRSARRVRAYVQHWQEKLKQPWSPRFAVRPDDPSADTLPNVAPALLPHPASFTRGYTLTTRTEAMRRGVRLLYEIHAYRDRIGNWPATLDALGPDVVDPFGIDPHGDKPFGYQVIAGEPLLYSLATNAKDDGGKHDDNWGDATNRITETDYVLWPVQP